MFKKIFLLILCVGIFLLPSFSTAADLVNINTATVAELDTLPGIGAVKAQAIVDYRTQNGPFAKIEDIMNVSGIGQVTYDNMKSMITVGTVETPPPPVVSPPPQSAPTNNTEIVETQKEILGYEIGSVVINELVSDPADGEVEFVELYNKSMRAIDLSGWWVEEGSKGKSILSYSIPSNGFFVLEKPKGSLNNTGDIVKLFDPAGGLIDQVVYGDWDDGNKTNNAPRADDPLSLARIFDGADSDNDITDFVLTEKITKGAGNIIFVKTKKDEASQMNLVEKISVAATSTVKTEININNFIVSTSSVRISEFFPNPTGTDSAEFIELYNFGETDADLSGYKIDDEDGGSSPYDISEKTLLKPGEYLVFANWETKISLNNTDDTVRLFDKNGKILEEVYYEDAVEGASYAKDENNNWSWSSAPTPGKKNAIKNIFSNKNSSSGVSKQQVSVNLENLRSEEIGSKVKVSGVVAVEPNIFGTQYFYIVNDFSGVQIYMYKKDFPELKIGDEVEVIGVISESYNETRIKVAKKEDIKKTGRNMEIIPQQIEIADIEESLEGGFVQVKGEITELKATYMYLDDGTDEIKVYFKKGAKIQSKDFNLSDLVEVKGVVGSNKGNYQLLPRSSADIQKIISEDAIVGAGLVSDKNTRAQKYLTITAGGLSSVLVGLFIKARGKFFLVFSRKISQILGLFVKRG